MTTFSLKKRKRRGKRRKRKKETSKWRSVLFVSNNRFQCALVLSFTRSSASRKLTRELSTHCFANSWQTASTNPSSSHTGSSVVCKICRTTSCMLSFPNAAAWNTCIACSPCGCRKGCCRRLLMAGRFFGFRWRQSLRTSRSQGLLNGKEGKRRTRSWGNRFDTRRSRWRAASAASGCLGTAISRIPFDRECIQATTHRTNIRSTLDFSAQFYANSATTLPIPRFHQRFRRNIVPCPHLGVSNDARRFGSDRARDSKVDELQFALDEQKIRRF